MTENTARDKKIKKVIRSRKIMNALIRLSGQRQSKLAKEIILDTEAGKVRTLWYGFDDPAVKPVFFDLHGGGFIMMSADSDDSMNLFYLKEVGCKIISIDYAKAPEHPFPAAVNQVYAVVKHVYQHAERYRIAKESMAIGGYSAGANLATVTCLQAARTQEFSFVCQALNYPPLDLFTSPYDKPCPKGAIKPHQASIYDACYISLEDASNPLVSPVFAQPDILALLPPVFLLLCGHDSLYNEGLRYADMLIEAGVLVELHDYPDERHGFHYYRSKTIEQASQEMAAFLTKHFTAS